jgi:hypothetical protein
MKFNIVSDTNYEAKVDQVTDTFSSREVEDLMHFKNYGSDLLGIVLVLMCRNPEYNFNQRIQMDKKNKVLYIDIMLDYNYFISDITPQHRIRYVSDKILEELPSVINKYKFKNFDLEIFMQDLKDYFKKIGWL